MSKVKKWSADLIIEMYKIGGSDFVGMEESIDASFLIIRI
jgi:hypothetical protein